MNRKYKVGGGSTSGGTKTYRYYFVGVIELTPEDPSRTLITVAKDKVKREAKIYALKKTYSAGKAMVSPECLITVGGAGKYYKVDGVDYSNRQGTPLFVRSEHYLGKEQ